MEELKNLTFNDLPQAVWRIVQELKELRENGRRIITIQNGTQAHYDRRL